MRATRTRALGRLALRVGSTSFVQSSALGIALLCARAFWLRELTYVFLLWNLVLAWVPYLCALLLRRVHRHGRTVGPTRFSSGLLVALFVAWLGFLPNAPYLVTDFIHLRYRVSAPLWFDAVMLASYAWAGVGLGVASLRICAGIVRATYGAKVSAVVVVLSAIATGFGIYLGRFVRLNTWDVATRPLTVLETSLSPIVHPFSHPRAWVVTLTFALFFLAAYGARFAGVSSQSRSNAS
jgi:uncharacterized membrane protein